MSVSEKPILFSGAMVRAILDGRKTQTRRVVKPQPSRDLFHLECLPGGEWRDEEVSLGLCPYGQPGDRLWVRETWGMTVDAGVHPADSELVYRATDPDWSTTEGWKWRPSIFMRRFACRLFLEVTAVRVERLQDISPQDAWAEAIPHDDWETGGAVTEFARLWDSINAKRGYGWESNPWVWVVEFRIQEAAK